MDELKRNRKAQNPNKNLALTVSKGNGTTFEEIEQAYWDAAEKHPGPAFSRKEFSDFLGGTPSSGRLANMDSEGIGPNGGFYDGRIKKYLKIQAVKWALKRLEV